jgi:hypothetical protein
VIYSPGTKRWWLFYVDSAHPSQLNATSSTDFVNWTAASPGTLPGMIGPDGSPLAVDLFSAQSGDIVEIAVTMPCPTSVCGSVVQNALFLMRGKLSGSSVAYDTPNQVCVDMADTLPYPDAPVVAVSGDNHVAIGSGCDPSYHGGAWTIYASSDADPGTPHWSPTWPNPFSLYHGPGMNNRALIPSSGTMFIYACEDGNVPPQSVYWAIGSAAAGFMTGGTEIFPFVDQDSDGWSLFADPTTAHAIRFATNTASYDHSIYNGTNWTYGKPAPDLTHLPLSGKGVFSAADGFTYWVFIIDDMTRAVMSAKGVGSAWTWSTAWSAMPSGNQRQFIAGNPQAVNHQLPLIWTEGPATSTGGYEIWGGLFCSQ